MKALSAGLFLGALACGQSSNADRDLSRDLELAGSANGLELAPSHNRTDVISAAERFAKGTPAPRAAQRSVAASPAPQAEAAAPVPAPTVAAQAEPAPAPEPQPEAKPEGSVRPRPATRPQPGPPPGGYKTVEEVIRKAPFPINP